MESMNSSLANNSVTSKAALQEVELCLPVQGLCYSYCMLTWLVYSLALDTEPKWMYIISQKVSVKVLEIQQDLRCFSKWTYDVQRWKIVFAFYSNILFTVQSIKGFLFMLQNCAWSVKWSSALGRRGAFANKLHRTHTASLQNEDKVE